MAETTNPIETRLTIPAESVLDFERMKRMEHRPSIFNAAQRIFLLGLEEWTRQNPSQQSEG